MLGLGSDRPDNCPGQNLPRCIIRAPWAWGSWPKLYAYAIQDIGVQLVDPANSHAQTEFLPEAEPETIDVCLEAGRIAIIMQGGDTLRVIANRPQIDGTWIRQEFEFKLIIPGSRDNRGWEIPRPYLGFVGFLLETDGDVRRLLESRVLRLAKAEKYPGEGYEDGGRAHLREEREWVEIQRRRAAVNSRHGWNL